VTDQQIAQALGDVQGTVRSMMEQWRRQEDTASAGRKALYEKFEGVSAELAKVGAKLDGVTQDVAEVKESIETKVMPTIDAYKLDVAHRGGAWATGKIIWALILALCTAVGFAIHEVALYFGHSPVGH
jgi:hypothetical protein